MRVYACVFVCMSLCDGQCIGVFPKLCNLIRLIGSIKNDHLQCGTEIFSMLQLVKILFTLYTNDKLSCKTKLFTILFILAQLVKFELSSLI